jgi:hypothetical protein
VCSLCASWHVSCSTAWANWPPVRAEFPFIVRHRPHLFLEQCKNADQSLVVNVGDVCFKTLTRPHKGMRKMPSERISKPVFTLENSTSETAWQMPYFTLENGQNHANSCLPAFCWANQIWSKGRTLVMWRAFHFRYIGKSSTAVFEGVVYSSEQANWKESSNTWKVLGFSSPIDRPLSR